MIVDSPFHSRAGGGGDRVITGNVGRCGVAGDFRAPSESGPTTKLSGVWLKSGPLSVACWSGIFRAGSFLFMGPFQGPAAGDALVILMSLKD
jgi:hypothetical protein